MPKYTGMVSIFLVIFLRWTETISCQRIITESRLWEDLALMIFYGTLMRQLLLIMRREHSTRKIQFSSKCTTGQPETSSHGILTRNPKNTTRSGSTITSLLLKPFKNALLRLQDLAFGTAPCIRHLLPGRPGRDPILGIAFCRVVNIMTFQTDPPCIFLINWHISFQLHFG